MNLSEPLVLSAFYPNKQTSLITLSSWNKEPDLRTSLYFSARTQTPSQTLRVVAPFRFDHKVQNRFKYWLEVSGVCCCRRKVLLNPVGGGGWYGWILLILLEHDTLPKRLCVVTGRKGVECGGGGLSICCLQYPSLQDSWNWYLQNKCICLANQTTL